MGAQREDVGVIIAQVKNTLNSGSRSYSTFFRALETQCASATAKIGSSLNSYTASIGDAQSNINNWNKNLGSAVRDVKDATANMAKGNVQLANLRKRTTKITLDYRVYASEADKKLNVVKVLRDIITDELLNRSPGALVQLNKFQEKLSELKELLNNNSDSLYSPMISVLLDLATEQNFSDQGVLKKILQNLNNLNHSLVTFRAKQEAALNADITSLKKQIRNVDGRIRAYRRMRAQAVSKQIDAQHYITFYKHEISHFKAEQNRKTNELVLFKRLCTFEKKVWKEGKQGLKSSHSTASNLFSSVQRLS
jgi:chromosome segregation ATPase